VQLKPGDCAWSYKCLLSVNDAAQSAQQMQSAPSARPVRLIVDQLDCKIKRCTRKNQAPRRVIELWGSIDHNGKFRTTDVKGCSQQLADAFRETDLFSWVHPPKDFGRIFLPVYHRLISEHRVSTPCTLGTFTVRNPDQCPLPVDFKAVWTVVDGDKLEDNEPRMHFALSHLHQDQSGDEGSTASGDMPPLPSDSFGRRHVRARILFQATLGGMPIADEGRMENSPGGVVDATDDHPVRNTPIDKKPTSRDDNDSADSEAIEEEAVQQYILDNYCEMVLALCRHALDHAHAMSDETLVDFISSTVIEEKSGSDSCLENPAMKLELKQMTRFILARLKHRAGQ